MKILAIGLSVHQFFWLITGPRTATGSLKGFLILFVGLFGAYLLGSLPLFLSNDSWRSYGVLSITVVLVLVAHVLVLKILPTSTITSRTNKKVEIVKHNNSFPHPFLDPLTVPLNRALDRYPYLFSHLPDGHKIFVLVLDALREDFVGKSMHDIPLTPNLDRLRSDHFYFSNLRVQIPWTKASVASFFTGEYLREHGTYFAMKKNEDEPLDSQKTQKNELHNTETYGHVLPDDEWTLAERLHHSGFQNAGFVQIDHINSRFNYDQGFDYYDNVHQYNRPPGTVLRKLLVWLLRKRPKNTFVYVHLKGPHVPYFFAHQNHIIWQESPYYRNNTVNPPHWDLPSHDLSELIQRPLPDDFDADIEDERDFIRHFYASELKSYDQFVLPKYTNSLKNLDIWSETDFMVTSDHGEGIYDHDLYYGHGENLFEEAINVPLVLKPSEKKVFNPRHIRKPISENLELIDLTATLLEWADAPRKRMSGESFQPLLAGSKKSLDGSISYSEKPGEGDMKMVAAVENSWKYIYDFSNKTGQLYNLRSDPTEQHPVEGHEKQKQRLKKYIIKNWDPEGTIKKRPEVRTLTDSEKDSLKGLGYMED